MSLMNSKSIPPGIEVQEVCSLHAGDYAMVDTFTCIGGLDNAAAATCEGAPEAWIWLACDVRLACSSCS